MQSILRTLRYFYTTKIIHENLGYILHLENIFSLLNLISKE